MDRNEKHCVHRPGILIYISYMLIRHFEYRWAMTDVLTLFCVQIMVTLFWAHMIRYNKDLDPSILDIYHGIIIFTDFMFVLYVLYCRWHLKRLKLFKTTKNTKITKDLMTINVLHSTHYTCFYTIMMRMKKQRILKNIKTLNWLWLIFSIQLHVLC